MPAKPGQNRDILSLGWPLAACCYEELVQASFTALGRKEDAQVG